MFYYTMYDIVSMILLLCALSFHISKTNHDIYRMSFQLQIISYIYVFVQFVLPGSSMVSSLGRIFRIRVHKKFGNKEFVFIPDLTDQLYENDTGMSWSLYKVLWKVLYDHQ